MITVICIVVTLAAIGWASDEWENRKKGKL